MVCCVLLGGLLLLGPHAVTVARLLRGRHEPAAPVRRSAETVVDGHLVVFTSDRLDTESVRRLESGVAS